MTICEVFLERGFASARYICFQTGYEIETFPLTKDDAQMRDHVTDVYFKN